MIKKLKVRNFKSLKDFKINFEKFNVLVGKNNSGKSNIIDCIKFLSDILKEGHVGYTIKRRGERYKDIVYGRDYKNDISIEVIVELDKKEFLYNISFSGVNEDIRLEDEEIVIRNNGNKKIIRWDKREKDIYTLSFTSKGKKQDIITTNVKELILKQYLFRIPEEDIIQSLYEFSEFIKNLKIYEFYPKEMKEPERRIRSPLQTYILNENGGNILEVLNTLYLEHKPIFDRISKLLCGVISDAEELKIMPMGTGMYIALKEKGFKEPFPWWGLSDGTIMMIAYITALHITDFFDFPYSKYKAKIINPLFCFEEPENNIYPRLFEFLVGLMKNSDAQVILTTHSPHIANIVDDDNLVIIKKDREGTTAVKQPKKIRMLKETYSENTGEMWMSGILKDLFGEE